MSSGQAGEFCCSLLLLFTQMNFSCFPLGHVSGWHRLFFSFPSLEILGFSCLAGLEKKWVLALSLLTLKQGVPSFLDCPSFLPALLLGMGNLNFGVQSPLLRSLSLGLPYSGDEAMIF